LTKVRAKREGQVTKTKGGTIVNGDPYNGPCAFGPVHLDLMVDLVVAKHLLHRATSADMNGGLAKFIFSQAHI